MNIRAIITIIDHEMIRFYRTLGGSILSPVITTSLFFAVFGGAIGSQIGDIGEIAYAAFIIPGMLLLTLAMQSTFNSAYGIFFQKFTGTIYEILSAPINNAELVLAFVLAATLKSIFVGSIILIISFIFVDYSMAHPVVMALFFLLTCLSFSLFGFIIGIWAKSFDQLQIMPNLVLTPLVFLGGSLYSIDMLPAFWQKITLINPLFYLIDGFRWSFFGVSHLDVWVSFSAMCVFITICSLVIAYIFKNKLHIN